MAKEAPQKRHKTHQQYHNAAGVRLPGVSTIVGVMDKPALVRWANNLGLDGIDSTKYVDSLAAAGTLAHYLAECELGGVKPDDDYLAEFSRVDMDLAENSMLKFYEWLDHHDIEVLGTEVQLVSEKHQYGGTCDIYAAVDGIPTLVDIKTCKAIYGQEDSKWTQLAAYRMLLEESGCVVEDEYILRIGRNESEGFEYARSMKAELHRKRFLICRELYEVTKVLKRK